jgi:flagellar biosynthesis anti-sigma factor FlgM
MTNTISPFRQTPPPATNVPEPPSTPAKPAASGSASSAPSQSEAVTLSEAAQTTTQLLNAARDSNGINQSAVDQIRGALANGSYNVSPADLAQAIATVLKETT